jgi:hypothetical protein
MFYCLSICTSLHITAALFLMQQRTNAVNKVHQTAGRSVSCQMRCDGQTKFDRPWSPEPIVISYLDAILLYFLCGSYLYLLIRFLMIRILPLLFIIY